MSEAAPHGGGKNEYMDGWDERAHQKAELEATTVHKTAEVRHTADEIMGKYVDLSNHWVWLYYRLPAKPAPGFPSIYNLNREILILRYAESSKARANIRILTNERISPHGEDSIFTEDFVLDNDNDAQYFIDALDNENRAGKKPTYSPIFYIENEAPRLINVRGYPPMLRFAVSDTDRRSAMPFGHYSHQEDKLDALNFGSELLAEVYREDPVSWGEINR